MVLFPSEISSEPTCSILSDHDDACAGEGQADEVAGNYAAGDICGVLHNSVYDVKLRRILNYSVQDKYYEDKESPSYDLRSYDGLFLIV